MTTYFATESNSVYEINGTRVRRVPEPRFTFEREAPNTLRGDNEWSELLQPCEPTPGRPAVLYLRLPGHDHPTLRTTSPVTRVWHDDKETE